MPELTTAVLLIVLGALLGFAGFALAASYLVVRAAAHRQPGELVGAPTQTEDFERQGMAELAMAASAHPSLGAPRGVSVELTHPPVQPRPQPKAKKAPCALCTAIRQFLSTRKNSADAK